MKYLYQTNKWLVIINTILFIITYLGLMFLIVLGTIQLLMYIIIAVKYNNLDKSGKTQFTIYSFTAALVLTLISFNDKFYFDGTIFLAVLVISILLAFLHLNITYLLFKQSNHETN
ncbi:hypothetical protein [Mariniflexile sp. HMF6888]|uniref:hypothetical protein n=1 Tax=Mariniflexile sp. HMF6888 TaxID=3373086 RepID=UPI00379674B4